MDIEAIVNKHARLAEGMRYWDAEILLRAALNELAAGYEERIAVESEINLYVTGTLQERIRQLESELVPEGWIPVSERLPPHNTHVVGLWQYPNGVTEFDVVLYEYDGDWYCESVRDPDYWCALPYAEPPAAAPQQEKEPRHE